MDYMARCNYLLAQGKFVGDVAYYYGDGAPKFFPTLQGAPGRPMIEGLNAGYDFDVVNTDVIINRMDVQDGKIVFPDGLSHNLLVLPNIPDIPDNVIQKVEKLIADGANFLVQNPDVAKKIKGKILTNNTIDEALTQLSLAKDFSILENKFDYIHKRLSEIDFYFVSNKTNETVTDFVGFRSSNKQVEIWNPVSGSQFKVNGTLSRNGKTDITITLAPYESTFIFFSPVERNILIENSETTFQTTEIKAPWQLSFPENWGAPSSIELDQLISWTEHEDKGVHFFSGTASYENTFTVSKETIDGKKTININLGEVFDVAEIFVNRKSAGILWTKPYQLNIQSLVKEGENKLEVQITNLWVNRIVGDLELPEGEKLTNSSRPFIEPYERILEGTIEPRTSGLLGPVSINIFE